MKNKKTKIKIKRSKVNLYNKKKNKTKQVVAIIITAAAACALCILGYGIGKPLMDYFKNRGSTASSSSVWTPAGSEASAVPENSASVNASSGTSEEPVPLLSNAVYYLSNAATLSYSSLNSELAAAKSAGASIVAATLKDNEGSFLYSSAIKKVTCKSTLSASQICEEIKKAGFIPAAKISTVKDKTNGVPLGCNYKFANGTIWIDDVPGKGKTWLSAFDEKTLSFIKEITAELSQSGFKRIILADTMYPNFYPVDIKTNLSHLPLSDKSKRTEALWNVVNSAVEGAQSGGAEVYIEMSGAAMIKDKKDGTNAELAYNASMLKTSNLIVYYSPTGPDAYASAQTFITSLKEALSGAECVVRITGSSSAIVESAKKAFDEAGIEAFSQ